MKYAKAIRDGYEVPLIGIPEDESQERCEKCGQLFDLLQIRLIDGKMVCDACKSPPCESEK